MTEEKLSVLFLTAHLLSYPSERFVGEGEERKYLVIENITSVKLRQELVAAYTPLYKLSHRELQELYVDTFDLKEKLGLYLTAHELGDSNKRGAALIKLQKVVNQAGFERAEGELADYIPMLFELLAVTPENNYDRLFKRLSVAIQRMLNNIEENNPYCRVLQLLMNHVFVHPTKAEIEELEYNREEADLEELPYPIMYQ